MRKNSFVFPLCALVAVVLFASCQKGDAGPAGPAGPAGTAGLAGAQGPKGDSGTANVIYSEWTDVVFNPANSDSSTWIATLDAPKLSKELLDHGVVKAYANFNTPDAPAVFSLPYFNGSVIINPVFEVNTITLISNADASSFPDSATNASVLQYRYVLIPGGTVGLKEKGVDLSDYQSVQRYYKIKD